jgi:hypothetical protein
LRGRAEAAGGECQQDADFFHGSVLRVSRGKAHAHLFKNTC